MDILGIRIDNFSKKEILEKIELFLSDGKFHQIATLNPEFILEAQKDEEFKNILNSCDLNVADGIGIKFAFLRFGKWLKKRMPGADLMHEILKIADEKKLSVFLAVNKKGLSSYEEVKSALSLKYPNVKFSGDDIDPQSVGYKIINSDSNLFLCNFGAPEQEKFINSLKNDIIGLAIGIGGSFDFITGKVKRAPKIMQNFGLEWLWRLILQPQRIRRMFNAVLIFPVKILFSKQMKNSEKKVRARFAPSPTGYMHVGNFRTALYAYLFAKKNKGDFILRIEDTDQKRYVQDALEKLIDIINWAGFEYSEGVFIENGKVLQKGDFGPYIQSERLDIYKKYADELVKNGKAYYCFCTPEKLEQMRNEQIASKQAPMYDKCCLKLSGEETAKRIAQGEKYVIRQKINTEGFTEYEDLIRGRVKIKNDLLDDQVLLKSDGYPTYNFANVIDDHLMGITHVIRGEEYVSSTPKYVQLYQNFGWEIPEFAHLPLLLNSDKSKLSKRQGDVSVEDYISKGYLREAIINFVALLGWNPGEGSVQEIFSMQELIDKFELEKVHKAGAVFDLKKLDWINAQYIKKMSDEDLYKNALQFFEKKDFYTNAQQEKKSAEYLKKVLTVEKDRLIKFSDVGEENKFFFQDISCNKEMLRWKSITDEEIKNSLETSEKVLAGISDENWNLKNLEEKLLEAAGEKRGDLLWPLRVALTGEKKSPSPFEVAWVIGKKETLKRINQALGLI